MRLLLSLLLMLQVVTVAQRTAKEPELKSVYIFNFAQFVEWPAEAFSSSRAPFVIGILGPDPLGVVLDNVIKGEFVHGHPMVVERYTSSDQAKRCHILFFGQVSPDDYANILTTLSGLSILTVGDKDGFMGKGGVIRIFDDHGKIRLLIDINAADAAKLKISSQLLRISQIIGQRPSAQ